MGLNHRVVFTVVKKYSSTTAPKKKLATSEYCLELVKKKDYENFLSVLLIPGPSRSSTIAVRAFNIEVASVRDQVSQPTIGLMRLEFWNDIIEKTYDGNPPAQPIAMEVWKAIQKQKLSKRYFRRIVEAREDNIRDKMLHSLAAVEDYAEKSVSSVFYLTLESLGIQNVHADHAASHIGKAQGIVNLLRGVPINASRNSVHLPLELLAKHKVSQNSVIKGEDTPALKDLAFEVASQANYHLTHARTLTKNVPSEARVALLPALAVELHLERLRKVNFNIFHPSCQQRGQWLPAKLLWRKFRNLY